MLNYFVNDGANHQARATLCYLEMYSDIESSWDKENKVYQAHPVISRWNNCREQGYVVSLVSSDNKRQLNIIFFEHRNSDAICAVKWEQKSFNNMNIDIADFGNNYKDKFDTSHDVDYGECSQMAKWVYDQLEEFWKLTQSEINKTKEL